MRLKIIPQITNIKEPINTGDKIIFKFGLVITQKNTAHAGMWRQQNNCLRANYFITKNNPFLSGFPKFK